MHLSTTLKERIWVLLVIAYSLGKSVLVWGTISKYGVDPLIFLFVDLAAAIPYGFATSRVVINFLAKEWSSVKWWALLAAGAHFAPDIYIFISIENPPTYIIVAVISVISLTTVAGFLFTYQQIRKAQSRKLISNN